MDIPDLVGKRLEDALFFLKEHYPVLKCEVKIYNSPRSGQSFSEMPGIERVIRQRLKDNEMLELIVSRFKDEPDSV